MTEQENKAFLIQELEIAQLKEKIAILENHYNRAFDTIELTFKTVKTYEELTEVLKDKIKLLESSLDKRKK